MSYAVLMPFLFVSALFQWGAPSAFQFATFSLVGLANTLLDFCVFNFLTRKRLGMPRIPANLISTSVGMSFSFAVNYALVFLPSAEVGVSERIFRFLAVNVISLYIIQAGVLWLTSYAWPHPVHWLARTASVPLLDLNLPTEFITRNISKAFATLASLTFNYLFYKVWVFE